MTTEADGVFVYREFEPRLLVADTSGTNEVVVETSGEWNELLVMTMADGDDGAVILTELESRRLRSLITRWIRTRRWEGD